MNQDFVAWVGQGRIADRTQENLGLSDRGILMLRKQLHEDLAAIERGEDPMGVIRDPAINCKIKLPVAERAILENGLSAEALRSHPSFGDQLVRFIFQAGQPSEVWQAFCEAVGVKADQVDDREVIRT